MVCDSMNERVKHGGHDPSFVRKHLTLARRILLAASYNAVWFLVY